MMKIISSLSSHVEIYNLQSIFIYSPLIEPMSPMNSVQMQGLRIRHTTWISLLNSAGIKIHFSCFLHIPLTTLSEGDRELWNSSLSHEATLGCCLLLSELGEILLSTLCSGSCPQGPTWPGSCSALGSPARASPLINKMLSTVVKCLASSLLR